jgi:hypothetical protein
MPVTPFRVNQPLNTRRYVWQRFWSALKGRYCRFSYRPQPVALGNFAGVSLGVPDRAYKALSALHTANRPFLYLLLISLDCDLRHDGSWLFVRRCRGGTYSPRDPKCPPLYPHSCLFIHQQGHRSGTRGRAPPRDLGSRHSGR